MSIAAAAIVARCRRWDPVRPLDLVTGDWSRRHAFASELINDDALAVAHGNRGGGDREVCTVSFWGALASSLSLSVGARDKGA